MPNSKFARAIQAGAQGFFQMSNFLNQQKQSAMQQELHQAQMDRYNQMESPQASRDRAFGYWKDPQYVNDANGNPIAMLGPEGDLVGGGRGGSSGMGGFGGGSGSGKPTDNIKVLEDIRQSLASEGININPATDLYPEDETAAMQLYNSGYVGEAISHALAGYYRKKLSPEYSEWVTSLPLTRELGEGVAGPTENPRAEAVQGIDNLLLNMAHDKASLDSVKQAIHSYKLALADRNTEIPVKPNVLAPLLKGASVFGRLVNPRQGDEPVRPFDPIKWYISNSNIGRFVNPRQSGGRAQQESSEQPQAQIPDSQTPAIDYERQQMLQNQALYPMSPQNEGMPLAPESFKSPAMSMMEQGNQGSSFGRRLAVDVKGRANEESAQRWQQAQTDLRMIDDSPEAIARFKDLHKQTVAPEQQRRIKAHIISKFEELGVPDIAIAGIMATIEHESKFSPYAVGDDGNARGLFQWNWGSRREAAPPITGSLLQDIDNQIKYFMLELSIPEYSKTKSAIASADSIESVMAGMEHFENYNNKSDRTPARTATANKWLTQLRVSN